MPKKKLPIGYKIKTRRKELGWTQDYLARVVGCSRIHIARLETNRVKNPGLDTLKKISYSLAMKLEDLCL